MHLVGSNGSNLLHVLLLDSFNFSQRNCIIEEVLAVHHGQTNSFPRFVNVTRTGCYMIKSHVLKEGILSLRGCFAYL